MPEEPKSRKESAPTCSSGFIAEDGTVVELILDDGRVGTTFAMSRNGEVAIAQSVEFESGEKVLPIPATNNLLRHRAVLLPGTPLPFESAEALLAEIRAYIRRYLSLSPDFLVVASAYALFSWVYDAFNEVPYLRFRGDFGSGKTRALTVVGSLLYKAFIASGASTVSPIFYTLDTFRGSLVIDEADFRFSDKDADVVKILNNGNVRGFPVLRQSMNQKREFDPRAFQVFGPKIVAMRYAFEDAALESRFLTEEMGQRAVDEAIPQNLPPSQESDAAALRRKLLMYRLMERSRVAIDPTLVDTSRAARMNQILVPLLSVVPTEAERHAIERVATRIDLELLLDRTQSPEASLLCILVDGFHDESVLSVKITDIAISLARSGAEFDRTVTPKYVGYLVRKRLHLFAYKRSGMYEIGVSERPKIMVLAKRFGVLDEV